MSSYMPEDEPVRRDVYSRPEEEEGHGWSHWVLMLACCLPMILIPLLIWLGVWTIR